MQATQALCPSPSLNYYCDQQFQFAEAAAMACEDFTAHLKLIPSDDNKAEISSPPPPNEEISNHQDQQQSQHEAEDGDDDDDDEGEEEEEEDDDDFSFVCSGAGASPISADDIFQNGQIRPIFPLFNRDLLLVDHDSETSDNQSLPPRPPVKKVFFEAPHLPSSSSPSKIEELAAETYCTWSKKAVEASPEVCKKSNSTGFSKVWRFRDLLNRSNSDGRDAFVFLSGPTTTTTSAKKEEKVIEKSEGTSEGMITSEVKIKVNANVGGEKVKGKKGGKSLSAHEIYVRSRASTEEDRRRRKSYLPYRPEIVGFFTNVNGGLSRNIHPF